MAQVVRYVDPDAAGAGNGTSWADAYTSLNAWNAAEATNLPSDGDYHTVNCRSSGGTQDTTAVTMTGWETDSTHYIEIVGADFPADAIFDGTKYVLNVTNSHVLNIQEQYVTLRNMQIQATVTSGVRYTVYIAGSFAGTITIDSCIIKGVCSGTGGSDGILMFNGGSVVVNVYNTIINGYISGADANFAGVRSTLGGAINMYNCTVWNCYRGISSANVALNAYNCAVGNCTDDFYDGTGNLSADYCCSDDGDGTNAQNPSGGDWANEFTDAANGDFSLVAGGNCIENGTNDPSSGLYSDDIIGTARS